MVTSPLLGAHAGAAVLGIDDSRLLHPLSFCSVSSSRIPRCPAENDLFLGTAKVIFRAPACGQHKQVRSGTTSHSFLIFTIFPLSKRTGRSKQTCSWPFPREETASTRVKVISFACLGRKKPHPTNQPQTRVVEGRSSVDSDGLRTQARKQQTFCADTCLHWLPHLSIAQVLRIHPHPNHGK